MFIANSHSQMAKFARELYQFAFAFGTKIDETKTAASNKLHYKIVVATATVCVKCECVLAFVAAYFNRQCWLILIHRTIWRWRCSFSQQPACATDVCARPVPTEQPIKKEFMVTNKVLAFCVLVVAVLRSPFLFHFRTKIVVEIWINERRNLTAFQICICTELCRKTIFRCWATENCLHSSLCCSWAAHKAAIRLVCVYERARSLTRLSCCTSTLLCMTKRQTICAIQ